MIDIVAEALKEDLGRGDITTSALIPRNVYAEAEIISKEDGIIAGMAVAQEVFRKINRKIKFNALFSDGNKVINGSIIARIKGPCGDILKGERVALNFLQRLSGIATITGKYALEIKGTNAKILDTRKTTPGLRVLEKNAVKSGGGTNHRMGLFDRVLIKDNHIAVAGNIPLAIKKLKKYGRVEIEAKNFRELNEALIGGADIILIDNMPIGNIKKAVKIIKEWNKKHKIHVKIEASGGINLENVKAVAKAGVDYISIGALTHSPKALDISLDIKKISK